MKQIFLGEYEITPFDKTITVQCFGIFHPKQRETLEQEGLQNYAELEKVIFDDVDISDVLTSDIWDELETLINVGN